MMEIVAPRVGAWIEIIMRSYGLNLTILKSLPVWERGLKYARMAII